MRNPAALFRIAAALGATILVAGQGTQAAPTAITSCQTISSPGSYVLANDLPAAAGQDCLTITTNFVSIDLAGFSITGSGGFTTGILNKTPGFTPLHGISVRNGSISNFREGVDLGLSTSIIEGLRVFGNSDVGIIAVGVVRGNIVENNQTEGISAQGVVTGNYATGNGIGIGSAGGTLSWNTAGVELEGKLGGNRIGISANHATLIGNTAAFNTETGILVDCPANLTDNTAVNNGTNLVVNTTAFGSTDCHNEDNVAP